LKNIIKSVGYILLFLAIVLGGVIGKDLGKVMSQKYISLTPLEIIETAIQKTVVEIRETLPKKIDDITTLVSVEGSGAKIMFFYVIDQNHEDLDKEFFHEVMLKKLSHDLCSTKSVADNFKLGATYAYHYKEKYIAN